MIAARKKEGMGRVGQCRLLWSFLAQSSKVLITIYGAWFTEFWTFRKDITQTFIFDDGWISRNDVTRRTIYYRGEIMNDIQVIASGFSFWWNDTVVYYFKISDELGIVSLYTRKHVIDLLAKKGRIKHGVGKWVTGVQLTRASVSHFILFIP